MENVLKCKYWRYHQKHDAYYLDFSYDNKKWIRVSMMIPEYGTYTPCKLVPVHFKAEQEVLDFIEDYKSGDIIMSPSGTYTRKEEKKFKYVTL